MTLVNAAPTKPKVLIAIPSQDFVPADAAFSWMVLQHYCLNQGIHHAIVNPKTSLIEVGRRNAVIAAHQVQATHLFFLDSDIQCPPDTIERLLAHQKDIAGASYVMRRPPFRLTHTNLDETHTLGKGLYEVMRLPTGCMLIDMRVFEKTGKPYFRVPWGNDGNYVSEDNDFCDRARERGCSIWLDADLTPELRHLGQYPYSTADAV